MIPCPSLDLRALTKKQLRTAKAIFEEFRDKELKPAYLADADANRALLDQRVVCDLLGFDEEVYRAVRLLAAKWCAEPSVHGGKARPKERPVDHLAQPLASGTLACHAGWPEGSRSSTLKQVHSERSKGTPFSALLYNCAYSGASMSVLQHRSGVPAYDVCKATFGILRKTSTKR